MTTARWQRKAAALADAWQYMYGDGLQATGVALGLGPAQLETRCGDSWPGPDGLLDTADDERNWGACTLRGLSAVELACLNAAGIKPTIGTGHVQRAIDAMAALSAAGIARPSGTVASGRIDVPSATIHCDSRTVRDAATGKSITIPHFVWFANFSSDRDGAAYYLHLLGTRARGVLVDGGSAYQLAAAMYAQGYFGGFHPHGSYVAADGSTHDGNTENIAAYEANIQYWLPEIRAALFSSPANSNPTLRRGAHGEAVAKMQEHLNALAAAGLSIDGAYGPLTEAAVRKFQMSQGLAADGICGPRTWAALGE